jgi:hypothetical protein
MSESVNVPVSKGRFSLEEDWMVVFAGFAIIFLSLSGVLIPVPDYNWETSNELFAKVLTPLNAGKIAAQLALTLTITIACSLLLNRRCADFSDRVFLDSHCHGHRR